MKNVPIRPDTPIKCPNCKQKYEIKESNEAGYDFMGIHDSPMCPFGFETHQKLELQVRYSIKEFLREKFPHLDT